MSEKKILKSFKVYPDMAVLGEHYANALDGRMSKKKKQFLASELKRMAIINEIVAEVLLKNETEKSGTEDFETYFLSRFADFNKSMSVEEKRNLLTRIIFPKE